MYEDRIAVFEEKIFVEANVFSKQDIVFTFLLRYP